MDKASAIFIGIIAGFIGIAMFRGALSNAWKEGRGLRPDEESKDNPYKFDHKSESKLGCLFYAIIGAIAIGSVLGIINLAD